MRLMRYEAHGIDGFIGLDDYVKEMIEDQKKIYFVTAPSKQIAAGNPFLKQFEGTDIPVLVIINNVDEIIFQQVNEFKGFGFVNIESSFEEVSKDLGDKLSKNQPETSPDTPSIPEEDISNFSLWLKSQTAPYVSKVTISRRITDVPAVMFG